jgi:sec-independent protein translocase protein TatA
MPFNIGPGELILILIIALVVLGPGKLPDVAASLGKGLREFRKAASDVTEAGKLDAPATPNPPAPAQAPAPPAATPAPAPSDAGDSAPSEPSGDSNQS